MKLLALFCCAIIAGCAESDKDNMDTLVVSLQEIFNEMDSDENSAVSKAEWDIAISRGFTGMKSDKSLESKLEHIFVVSDANNDLNLSFSEYSRQPILTFRCLDANNDRLLDDEEKSDVALQKCEIRVQ